MPRPQIDPMAPYDLGASLPTSNHSPESFLDQLARATEDSPSFATQSPSKPLCFSCSVCNRTLKADVKVSGMRCRCPHCGNSLRVPAMAAVPSQAESRTPSEEWPSAPANVEQSARSREIVSRTNQPEQNAAEAPENSNSRMIPIAIGSAVGLCLLVAIVAAAYVTLSDDNEESIGRFDEKPDRQSTQEVRDASKRTLGPIDPSDHLNSGSRLAEKDREASGTASASPVIAPANRPRTPEEILREGGPFWSSTSDFYYQLKGRNQTGVQSFTSMKLSQGLQFRIWPAEKQDLTIKTKSFLGTVQRYVVVRLHWQTRNALPVDQQRVTTGLSAYTVSLFSDDGRDNTTTRFGFSGISINKND